MFHTTRAIVLAGAALCATSASAATVELSMSYEADTSIDRIDRVPPIQREFTSPDAIEKNGAIQQIITGLIGGTYTDDAAETKDLILLCSLVNNLHGIGTGPKKYSHRGETLTEFSILATSAFEVVHKTDTYFVNCRYAPKVMGNGNIGAAIPTYAMVGHSFFKDEYGGYYDVSVANLLTGNIFHLNDEYIGYIETFWGRAETAYAYLARNASYSAAAIETCTNPKNEYLGYRLLELSYPKYATFSRNPYEAYDGPELDAILDRWDTYRELIGYRETSKEDPRVGIAEYVTAKSEILATRRVAGALPEFERAGVQMGYCDGAEDIITFVSDLADPFNAGYSGGYVSRRAATRELSAKLGFASAFVQGRVSEKGSELLSYITYRGAEPVLGDASCNEGMSAIFSRYEDFRPEIDPKGDPIGEQRLTPAQRQCVDDLRANTDIGYFEARRLCIRAHSAE